MGKLLVRRERMEWRLHPENCLSSCNLEHPKMPLFKIHGGDLDHSSLRKEGGAIFKTLFVRFKRHSEGAVFVVVVVRYRYTSCVIDS